MASRGHLCYWLLDLKVFVPVIPGYPAPSKSQNYTQLRHNVEFEDF